uniref:Sugar phosphate phosphatase n=1 Tax=Parascaris univalens TaxID=6257 RepID=A0A915CIZ6_PARUN
MRIKKRVITKESKDSRVLRDRQMPPIASLAPALNGVKEGTFVYKTIKDRWPAILTKVIDQVHRYRHTHIAVHPKDGDRDIKAVIGELAEMRYHLATDKPLRNFDDDLDDISIWNEQLEFLRKMKTEAEVSWYRADWLFVECYLYRRIVGALRKTTTLKQFDPFSAQKHNAYVDGLPAMEQIAKYLTDIEQRQICNGTNDDAISRLLQLCLWGNKCDLSFSCGENAAVSSSPIDQTDQLADKVLVNQIDAAMAILRNAKLKRIDIVLDNAGLELFSDMVLADFLVTKSGAAKVVFHGKAHPWFVSDTTSSDFCWINEMLRGSHVDCLSKLGYRWDQKLTEGQFEFHAHEFWTLPFAYCDMPKYAADLYKDLSEAALIIFKGDLNYRRLVGDREWPLDTPFKVALRGFAPAPLLALRVLKAETQVGLSVDTIKMLEHKFSGRKGWMVSGDYAVVQFDA